MESQKRAAASAAIKEVRDGMVLGLGTGTTAAFAISEVAKLVSNGMALTTVATSEATATAARSAGLIVRDMAGVGRLDLAIDGIDEIDLRLRAIKGAGGAMLREKIVAAAADRMIVIGDSSKFVERIGGAPVPLEVLPFARRFVEHALVSLGGSPTLRLNGEDFFRTDQDNIVLDCHFGHLPNPEALSQELSGIPGVMGHGLFLHEIAAAYIAFEDEVRCLQRQTRAD